MERIADACSSVRDGYRTKTTQATCPSTGYTASVIRHTRLVAIWIGPLHHNVVRQSLQKAYEVRTERAHNEDTGNSMR